LKPGDKMLIVLLTCAGALCLAGFFFWRSVSTPKDFSEALSALYVVVEQEGEQRHRIDLTRVEAPYTLRLENEGGHYNVLLLEPGRIRFIEADCPHGDCIASGWLSRPGEMALCLPHRVLVHIEGMPKEASVDAVSH